MKISDCIRKKDLYDIRFTFGKYKGERIYDIYKSDQSYIDWCIKSKINMVVDFCKKINQEMYDWLEQEIKKHIKNNETCYWQNIHSVGTAYIISNIHVEEVIGNQFQAFICNGKDSIWVNITKEQCEYLHEIMYEQYKKTGKHSIDRGLY